MWVQIWVVRPHRTRPGVSCLLAHLPRPKTRVAGAATLLTATRRLGDIIDCLLAYWIIRKADQIEGGLPQKVKNKMYINVAADFAIGLVPVLGDIADALYKANSRNTWLLEEYLVKKAEAEQAAAGGNLQARGPTDDPEQGILTAPKKTQKMQGTRP